MVGLAALTGQTAYQRPVGPPVQGLSQISTPGNPKPTVIFKPIELLPGGSKNYGTKSSRTSSLAYTLYFWPSSKIQSHFNGRPDRSAVVGQTATLAGRTAAQAGRTASLSHAKQPETGPV